MTRLDYVVKNKFQISGFKNMFSARNFNFQSFTVFQFLLPTSTTTSTQQKKTFEMTHKGKFTGSVDAHSVYLYFYLQVCYFLFALPNGVFLQILMLFYLSLHRTINYMCISIYLCVFLFAHSINLYVVDCGRRPQTQEFLELLFLFYLSFHLPDCLFLFFHFSMYYFMCVSQSL